MKQPFESAATFTAYATIEAGYFMITQFCEASAKQKHPMTSAIDAATGYDKYLEKKDAKALIPVIKDIIAAKRVIDGDASKDEELLTKLQALITDKPPTDEEK